MRRQLPRYTRTDSLFPCTTSCRSPMRRRELGDEIDQASRLLRDALVPFQLNVAPLGNLVPQRHVHVIARFENDPAWPAPVWGRVAARPYTPEDLVERINTLNEFLRA